MKFRLLIILACAAMLPVFSQTQEWSVLERGNAAYRESRYAVAEKAYLQALQARPDDATAHYNLACAYLAQQNDVAALEAFEKAVRLTTDEVLKARAWHNIGTIHQDKSLVDAAQRKNWLRKAADAYKESLRANPADDETRYNLALCLHQLRNDEQENPQHQENQQDEQPRPQDNPEPRQDPTQQLLNLAQRAENETRKKINDSRQQPTGLDKNW